MDIYSSHREPGISGSPRSARAIAGIVILALILAFAAVQFIREIFISFKAYSIIKGMSGSPWVGFENYRVLFEKSAGSGLITNTILYNLLFAFFSCFIALLGGLVLQVLSKKSILRDTLAVLAILPLFIPAEVYGMWYMNLLGSVPFTNPGSASLLIPLLSALKYAGIPIMITHILGMLKKTPDMALSIKCAGLFSLTSLSLAGTGHFSLLNQFVNPLSARSTETLDTFSFRIGFMQMDAGLQAAAGVIQVLITLILTIVLFVPIKILFKSAFSGEKQYSGYPALRSLASAGIAFAVFILLYLLPYILSGKLAAFQGFRGMGGGHGAEAGALSDKIAFAPAPAVTFQWILVSIAAALICTVIAFLAGSFSEGGNRIRSAGVILLAAITILLVRPFTMSGFMTIRSTGMFNTYFAVIAASMFSTAALWAFAALRRDEEMRSIPGLVFGALGIFLLQMALVYSDGTQALLYLNRPDMSPIQMYKQLITMMQSIQEPAQRLALTGTLGISGLMVSVPAVLMFLLAKILLPAEAMLTVIAGARKH